MMMPPGVGESSALLNSNNFQTRRACDRNHNDGKRNTCLHRVRQYWFILQYALCIMHSVLCSMYDGLCIVYYVLCIMYYVLCIMYYVFCILYSVLCVMYNV